MDVATTMQIDAALLIFVALAVLVLLAEDRWFTHWPMRPVGVGFGIASFSQAMWLLGVWVPGTSGFPWPRIMFDALLLLLVLIRVSHVLSGMYRSRQARQAATSRLYARD